MSICKNKIHAKNHPYGNMENKYYSIVYYSVVYYGMKSSGELIGNTTVLISARCFTLCFVDLAQIVSFESSTTL